MAAIVIPAASLLPLQPGGIVLKAAGLVAADTAETGVIVDKGAFCVQMDWTACEIGTGDEFYNVTVEAEDSAGVYTRLGVLNILGAAAVTGGEGDAPPSGSVKAGFNNPYVKSTGSKVRVKCWVNGTIATGLNYSATLFPLDVLKV